MINLRQQVAQPRGNVSTFIYALIDPRNQAIRYIGKSVRPRVRFSAHLSQSSLKRPSHKNHWIKSLLKVGLKPQLEILDEVDHRDDWTAEETVWIVRIRSLAPGYPTLTNATDGGEGATGWVPSEEWRIKRSIAQTGRKMPPGTGKKISDANRGVPKSKEARAHFSYGQRNRWGKSSEEERKHMLSNLRNPQSPQRREQTSRRARNAPRPTNASSGYRNVVKLKGARGEKIWRASCALNGKLKIIGLFYTEIEAAHARDRFVLKNIGEDVPLNFPISYYQANPIETFDNRKRHSKKPKNNTLGYKGIYKNGENGWAASINYMGVRYRLGTHRTPEQAARAYDRKAIELFGDFARTNFPRSDYD